jgi:hypothetical protein
VIASKRLAVLVLVLAILSVLVGFLGAPHRDGGVLSWDSFSWELLAVAGTAVGTSALGFATYLLARKTSEGLVLQRQAIDGDREARALQIRPLLTEAPDPDPLPDGFTRAKYAEGRIEIDTLRNAGNGPALIVRVAPRFDAPVAQAHFKTTVLPGERFPFTIQLHKPPKALPEYIFKPTNGGQWDQHLPHYSNPENFVAIDIDYLDAAGGQPQRTTLFVTRDAGQAPLVGQFILYEGDPPKEWRRLNPLPLIGFGEETRPWIVCP